MDTGRPFLIDTNILFQLEDDRPVAAEYAEMQRRCSTHGVSLYVHEVSKLDIDRDKNASRRSISMSKLSKFQMLCGVAASSQLDLDRTFGPANDENTKVDVALLDAVRRGIVDFLVTHDEGIHRRARRAGIEDRVFRIRDAIDWLLATYEPTSVVLPYIRDAHCFNIAPHDPILATLREDYPDFDRWFRTVQKRPCWILEVGAQTEIAGILIRKDSEPRQDTDATSPGERILKFQRLR